ncbi:hypothetical protein ACFWZ2_38685 [Streptomyces sp. NPDC059002]|uniref:hypothetical protein n=1 Tax=Streptomyces sp. NPDC059002 TaxID=3346690 RepID=UPI0036B39803
MLHEAEERRVRACMRQRGMRYVQVPPGPGTEPANPYGLLTPETARQDGYGMVSSALTGPTGAATTEDVYARATRDLSARERARWLEAVEGTKKGRRQLRLPDGATLTYATDGCVAKSQRLLYGSTWRQTSARVQGLVNLVLGSVERSSRYKAAERDWAACMRAADRPYDSLRAPAEDIQDSLNSSPGTRKDLLRIGAHEQALAVEDARCQQRTRFAERVRTVQRTVEADLTPTYQKDLTRYTHMRAASLRNARSS